MITPSQYKARYVEMDVYTQWGATTPVCVDRYRLNDPKHGNVNKAAMDAFMKEWRKGIDAKKLDIRVVVGKDIVRVDQDTVDSWGGFIRYCFLGKGSPELHQVVMQLAVYWDLATYDGLQKYADDALGIDCNGFVGNYLWHIKQSKPWRELGYGDNDVGADAAITEFVKGAVIKKWHDIDYRKSHILAMVDGHGRVIGGGKTLGHVMITEPNWSIPIVWPKPYKKPDSFTLRVVECTGGHTPGLWESWYSPENVIGPVFTVNRPAMIRYKQLPVKIAEVR